MTAKKATDARRNAKRGTRSSAETEALRREGKLLRAAGDMAAMAVGLSIHPGDPVKAAAMGGIAATRKRAEALAAQAREQYPELAEARPGALVRVLDAVLGQVLARTLRQLHLVSPRDLAHVADALSRVRDRVRGPEVATYSQIVLEVVPPSAAVPAAPAKA